MLEGDALLEHLKEVNPKADPETGKSEKQSNSYVHLEGIVSSVRTRYQEVDSLLGTIKTKLESNLQIKLFEKDAMEASQNLEHWAEELKFLNENQNDDARAPESTESWLHSQIQTANQMQVLVFELLQRGSDLVTNLEKTESSSSLSLTSDVSEKNNDNSLPSTPTATNLHTLNWLKQQNSLNGSMNVNNKIKIKCLCIVGHKHPKKY